MLKGGVTPTAKRDKAVVKANSHPSRPKVPVRFWLVGRGLVGRDAVRFRDKALEAKDLTAGKDRQPLPTDLGILYATAK